ncbi:MAG: hypothetical protein RLZZ528_2204 [Pseudomonadota bacterium]
MAGNQSTDAKTQKLVFALCAGLVALILYLALWGHLWRAVIAGLIVAAIVWAILQLIRGGDDAVAHHAPAAPVQHTPAPAPAPAPAAPPAPVAVAPAPVAPMAPAAPAKPQGLSAARGGKPDDLKLIKGVGPKLEALLHSLGYFHFDQIAGWTAAEVAWVDDNLEGFKGRVTRDEWVAQARDFAAGKA